jgi:hypothetical protein
MAILVPRNGVLIAVPQPANADGTVAPGLITIAGLKGGGVQTDILVTSFETEAAVAHQVTPSIGGPQYLFVFGDKLVDIAVGIVMYPGKCASGSATAQAQGYLQAWQFYNSNRIQTNAPVAPVAISYCGVNIVGLVVGFKSAAAAPSDAASSLIRGTLMLKGWVPPENLPGSTSGSGGGSGSGSSSGNGNSGANGNGTPINSGFGGTLGSSSGPGALVSPSGQALNPSPYAYANGVVDAAQAAHSAMAAASAGRHTQNPLGFTL